MIACLLLLFLATVHGDVAPCSRKNPPPSWLTTTGHGLEGWATAGVAPVGPNFCLQGSADGTKLEVDYHIHLSREATLVTHKENANATHSGGVLKVEVYLSICESFECYIPPTFVRFGEPMVVYIASPEAQSNLVSLFAFKDLQGGEHGMTREVGEGRGVPWMSHLPPPPTCCYGFVGFAVRRR
uniref:Uncharacterized protein n=1 Tax=Steinernema glaseri TaxID=37863 RepID=A0A1I7Y1I8_9BILA